MRELDRISRAKGKKRGSAAIPLDELPSFLTKVRADADLSKGDTVELIEFMLASGWRVAEACGLDAASVNFAAGTATVEAINVRVKGKVVVTSGWESSRRFCSQRR